MNEKKFGGKNGVIDNLSEWRAHVLRACDNKCCLTGLSGELYRLEAHHLQDKSTHPSLALDVKNGIALIRPLHVKFHEWMGGFHVPTTKKYFERWVNLPETKRLISKYKNKTVAPKKEQIEKIKYIERPPKKRTQNGNYIHLKSSSRYDAKEKDKAHDSIRATKKLLQAKNKTTIKYKRIIMILTSVIVLFLIYKAIPKQLTLYYQDGYSYMWVGNRKIWFNSCGEQMDCEPKFNKVKQLGDYY